MTLTVTVFIKGVSKYIKFTSEEQEDKNVETTFPTVFVDKGEMNICL